MAQDFATFCRCRATNDKPSCYRTAVPLDMQLDAGCAEAREIPRYGIV